MKLSERQAIAIKNLAITAQEDDQVLTHPLATLKFLQMLDPDLDVIKAIYPWIEQHENEGLKLKDIVDQLLQTLSAKNTEECKQ